MRFQLLLALAVALPMTACGILGAKDKPAPSLDNGELITRPEGATLVSRCPVPASYDDATLKKIDDALHALPPDNILHKVMNDYETERDNLRMCQ